MTEQKSTFLARNRGLIVALVLSALIAAIYAATLGFDFINLDDDIYVLENGAIRNGITAASVKWAFTSFHAANWHPLTWLSHALDVEWFGLGAGGHHAVNIVFHAANSIILFFLIRMLTGQFWESAVVAVIFAIHPAHVESVAWISERKDVLSTLFWLLATYFYVKHVRNSGERRFYILSLGLFAAGLASKPMLVTLPFTLLLLDYWPLKRFATLKFTGLLPLIVEKMPFFALAAASAVVTVLAQGSKGAIQSTLKIPVGERILNAVVSYAKYVGMMFYPADLGVWYPFESGLSVFEVVGSAVVVAVISAVCIWQFRERKYLFVGWFWFVGTLVPVIGFVQVGRQALADRYTYVPFIGLSIALVWLVSEIIERFRVPSNAVAAACAAVILVTAVISFEQVSYWKNTETLSLRTLSVTRNNYLIESNYCIYLERLNRLDEAASQCRAAIEHDPTLVEAYNGLGTVQIKQGKLDDARVNFERLVEIDPKYALAYGNLAIVETNRQNVGKAAEYLVKAVELDQGGYFDRKRRAEGFSAIAVAAMKQPRYDVAADCFRRAVEAAPENLEYLRNLALAYKMQGKTGEAQKALEEVIRKNPNVAEAYNTLGTIYAEQGRRQDAIVQFQRALQLNPNFAAARANLQKISGAGEQ